MACGYVISQCLKGRGYACLAVMVDLRPDTRKRVAALFPPEHVFEVERLLEEGCGDKLPPEVGSKGGKKGSVKVLLCCCGIKLMR